MLSKFNGINNQFYANTNLKIGRPHLSRQFSSQFEEKARRLSIDIPTCINRTAFQTRSL